MSDYHRAIVDAIQRFEGSAHRRDWVTANVNYLMAIVRKQDCFHLYVNGHQLRVTITPPVLPQV